MPTTAELIKAYGPHAFGLVTVLVIWFSMMKPQLDAARTDFDKMQEITSDLSSAVEANRDVSGTLKDTAQIIERVTERQTLLVEALTRRD